MPGDDSVEDIDAQIAELQRKKRERQAKDDYARQLKEKEEAKVLVNSTPKKASIRAITNDDPGSLPKRPVQPNFSLNHASSSTGSKPKPKAAPQILPSLPQSGPSKMGSLLAARRSRFGSSASPSSSLLSMPTRNTTPRSNGFEERNKANTALIKGKGKGKSKSESPELEVEDEIPKNKRDDNLNIIENLVLGPKEFGTDTEGEKEWRFVEPNSGIRLSKRILSHSHLQDHLSGRYFLTSSQIYSVIRLSRDGATYDIPVDGDWITIAVVAQRGEVKISGNKDVTEYSSDEEEDDNDDDAEHTSKSLAEALKVGNDPGKTNKKDKIPPWKKQKKNTQERKRVPKKYINFTLCSLPPRTHRSAGTSTSGDALLQLLLFEADAVVREEHTNEETGEKEITKSYRGGSGGAYEKWCNLTEGNVIAILNPRVWRNLRGGSNGPHPLEFPLGLNPYSADSIILLGQAKDLGRCNAMQKDGNRCKTWVDLRQNQVCEYHVHAAIQRGKSGRAEFTASTSSFALATRSVNGSSSQGSSRGGIGKSMIGFDAKRKTGLLPGGGRQAAPRGIDNGGGGATYIVGGGKVINTESAKRGGLKGFGEEYLSEKLGRNNKHSKKRKQLEIEREEKDLQNFLRDEIWSNGGQGNGTTGARYLNAIEKQQQQKRKDAEADKNNNEENSSQSNNSRAGKLTKQGKTQFELDKEQEELDKKRPFNAQAIKRIGFDPTSKSSNRDGEDVQRRLDAIAALKGEEKGCKLERLSKKLEEENKAKRMEKERIARKLKERENSKSNLVSKSMNGARPSNNDKEDNNNDDDDDELMIDLD
ncbi:uncharacterized protein L201_002253 [Kwoniella dendrophila CBS 6074]|uniref:Zinc finger Mcm10/DnaG-type domain-containing protein n=1 Tax=Kwoniella dendrophila CBS 6074 TaxID=1295534 RepID=A0AAX4JR78_9TREE